ncbi:FAD-dependent oxidoreductase [Thermosynechococcus sp. JY1334]|uniref:NAD(P)/FAD-dependent oxidoreductase n=1 Tax=unclassified Thermosynechococcus TaxID=2622553 RepID=UPI002865DB7F|nr:MULTISPECIES: FAD-dependent oxidoreductase [unclassified Thermosynechococcus]MDR7905390.1 FAD-dependent oxidoreductase [Thermosynechococcus sp. JY1334]WNC54068.1 FAD-dependent oxidoreductase [Thermosynechococcus sp. JY1331]
MTVLPANATVTIVGAGVVGSAIAYELSRVLDPAETPILVLEAQREEDWQATGAALGVLIVHLSRRRRGRNFQLRQASLARYETLIPELAAETGVQIPYQRRGIIEICTTKDEAIATQAWLQEQAPQGVQWLSPKEVQDQCPLVDIHHIHGALWATGDRQVTPKPLTQALRQAAHQRGVKFLYQSPVRQLQRSPQGGWILQLNQAAIETEYLILAAGLGTTPLTQALDRSVTVEPVLGQALEFACHIDGNTPVMTAEGIHFVPLPWGRVWVGATVEFNTLTANPQTLDQLHGRAIELWPVLKTAPVTQQWQGLRPRPSDRPAPIIEKIDDHTWLATGHYRNGILLAPITAQKIAQSLRLTLAKGDRPKGDTALIK